MDPVAAQFLSQLDAAEEELPKTVVSGLQMCGEDVAPALRERVRGKDWPTPTRCFSAYVLGQLGVADVHGALLDAFCEGDPVLTSVIGPLLVGGGAQAGQVLLARSQQPELIPELRAVLGVMAVQAGIQDVRLEALAIELLPLAPEEALQLMVVVPSSAYAVPLKQHAELLRPTPELALQVLAATLEAPDAEKEISAALGEALGGFMRDVFEGLDVQDPDQP